MYYQGKKGEREDEKKEEEEKEKVEESCRGKKCSMYVK